MDENQVLTTQEVAEMLKIAKNTVYELIKRGEINSYRVGKKVRFDLKDVEAYKNKTKTQQPIKVDTKETRNPPLETTPLEIETSSYQNNFVICGQDILLDVLVRHLQFHSNGLLALRSYASSYNALYGLYQGTVHAATTHLWDSESGEYNIPYVKRMLPGTPALVIHLGTRMQGFYVPKGNPKEIITWSDLLRDNVTMINREKGSGTRVLLDEHLKILGVSGTSINGYQRESTSHLTIASTVARGDADVGLGNEKSCLQVPGLDFIPLQRERLDFVIKKENAYKPPYQAILEILNSNFYKNEIKGIGGYDLTDLGKIVGET